MLENNTSLVNLFDSEEFGRTTVLMIDNEVWFIGREIAEKLEYENPSRDINRHVEEQDRKILSFEDIQNYRLSSFTSPRGLTIINESGLYSLILGSRMPKAKEYKHYVTSVILVNIRKKGYYSTLEGLRKMTSSSEFILAIGEQMKKLEEDLKTANEQIKLLEPKAEKYEEVIQKNQGLFSMNQAIKLADVCKVDSETGEVVEKLGRTKCFRLLRGEFFTNENVPKQKYMNRNYFEVKLVKIRTGEDVIKTYVTPRGLDFILSFLNKKGYSSRQKIDWKNKEQIQEIINLMKEEELGE